MSLEKAMRRLAETQSLFSIHEKELENVQYLICECYCKFPEEYLGMYKDVDEAFENLGREKCSMCPLMDL